MANEVHVSGHVSWAARSYLAATRDVAWLARDGGLDLVLDLASFWQSRPVYNESIRKWQIDGEL